MAIENKIEFSVGETLANPEIAASIAAEVIDMSLHDKHLHLEIFEDPSGRKKESFLSEEGLAKVDIEKGENLFTWSINVLSLLNMSGDFDLMPKTQEESIEFRELIGKCLLTYNSETNDFTKEERNSLRVYLKRIIGKNSSI